MKSFINSEVYHQSVPRDYDVHPGIYVSGGALDSRGVLGPPKSLDNPERCLSCI